MSRSSLPEALRQAVRDRCQRLPGSAIEYPWGPEDEVHKVGGKAFAFMSTGDPPLTVALKCDPNRVPGLRAVHPGITAPHYLNKNHWNSVALDERIPRDELLELVEHSYDMVVAKLPRRLRDELEAPAGSSRG
jgi:predicted DNA-binding protein (MmcQ/YjbR family)